MEQVVP
jgi:IS5 family transposase